VRGTSPPRLVDSRSPSSMCRARGASYRLRRMRTAGTLPLTAARAHVLGGLVQLRQSCLLATFRFSSISSHRDSKLDNVCQCTKGSRRRQRMLPCLRPAMDQQVHRSGL